MGSAEAMWHDDKLRHALIMPPSNHASCSQSARAVTKPVAALVTLALCVSASPASAIGEMHFESPQPQMTVRQISSLRSTQELPSSIAQTARDSVNRARDSIRAHRSARDALKMHHYRFRLLMDPPGIPWTQPSDFTCEMSVYPYCFGPMNGDVPFGQLRKAFPVEFRTWDPMVPDFLRRTVRRLVATLTRALDDAAERIPGDRWVSGQRTFQLVQNGQIHQAQEAARECRAEHWWCAALFGYASYLLNQHDKADSAFSVTLAAVGEQERCNWEEVGDLVYGDRDRSWYTDLSCSQRSDINRTLWWLADPLYITPGNERLTAHYYREVFRQLFSQSNEELSQFIGSAFVDPSSRITGSGRPVAAPSSLAPTLACTMSEREVWQQGSLPSLLRSLGVPAYFMLQRHELDNVCPVRIRLPPGLEPPHDPRILLQYPQPTYHFIPDLAAVRNPLRATIELWDVFDSNAVERYKPSFGTFTTLDYQLAYFRRGESARIVAAVDLATSGIVNGRSNQLISSALVLSRSPDDVRILHDSIPGTNVTFLSTALPESTIVSIEALVSGTGAARARFASGPPPMPRQRLALSDILLLNTSDSLPRSLEAAAQRARPNTFVDRGALGVYWEVYGLVAGDSMTVAIAASETGRSTATTIGRFIGVVRDAQRSGASWTELIAADETIGPRNLVLDLSTLAPGKHTLTLDVVVPGQDTVRVMRNIEIVRAR